MSDDQTLLVISEKGFGKKTKVANFPGHKRGGVGIKAAVVTAKTGPIISLYRLSTHRWLRRYSSPRTVKLFGLGLDDIKLLGRTTQGVTITRLAEAMPYRRLGSWKHQQRLKSETL